MPHASAASCGDHDRIVADSAAIAILLKAKRRRRPRIPADDGTPPCSKGDVIVTEPLLRGDYAAVLHILSAPGLWSRAEPYVRDDDFDWSGLRSEAETMSGGQALLVGIAYELWNAEKTVGLWEVVRRLDPRTFRRVVDALAICRGGGLADAFAA
jgi:hypothetical protein